VRIVDLQNYVIFAAVLSSGSLICLSQKPRAIHRFAFFSFLHKACVYCNRTATAPANAAALPQIETRKSQYRMT